MRNRILSLAFALTFVLCSASLLTINSLRGSNFSITFFNIGHGDAMFIQTPNNGQVLIDGGPSPEVLSKLGERMPFYDNEIELVFISHLHADHITGVVEILRRYSVGTLLVNDYNYDSPVVKQLVDEIGKTNTKVRSFYRGDSVIIDGVEIRSLWPEEGATCENINDCAQVLHVSYGDFDALLTSDVELSRIDIGEEYSYSVDVLKVPHQGNKSSVSQDVVNRMKPVYAIFSVGENNYGHPNEEIVSMLRSFGTNVMRTDEVGDIEFEVKNKYDKPHLSVTK
ncbi:MBL fold metallo-hydrolase [candidate division WWE3 bacterium]|uniref:MBL fold metallo-hydrolase n=1 Tax=candidate division WWE3 bacterium TaxID=2053526 RepID=A0A955RRT8_UNCKA|nr:MBL fold metallo-hydrolase [candidate division WWE3 bacterium]